MKYKRLTDMVSWFEKIAAILKALSRCNLGQEFPRKYQCFQNLLESHDRALEGMAILSEMLNQKEPFAFGKGRHLITGILDHTLDMLESLQGMDGGRYAELRERFLDLFGQVEDLLSLFPRNEIRGKEEGSGPCQKVPYSVDLHQVTMRDMSVVGGKMARLGEVKNILGFPVPYGVCLTSRCFEEFFQENQLRERIDDLSGNLDINNSVEIQEVSQAIQAMLVSAPIPTHIESEILTAYDRLCRRMGKECLLAVRSSAVGEDDPRHSFAGLHYTALNVSRQNLVDACWEVLVSKYLPESMVYRFVTGLRDVDMPMNIGCMEMLHPVVSGTLFTLDPQQKRSVMIIQAVRGVGSLVVEGKVTPQEYVVERGCEAKVLEFSPGNQQYLLQPRERDGLDRVEFTAEQNHQPFVSQQQIEFLVRYGLSIEAHFGIPQDIEWAINRDGRIYLLQTRPLQVLDIEKVRSTGNYSLSDLNVRHRVIVKDGDCACQGVGSGNVFFATQERFLVNFPAGGVLVARNASPVYARVLHKAAAVVAETGSTTGHLSIIARELGVPTVINVKDATKRLKNEGLVTVDANNGVVFSGTIDELVKAPGSDSEKAKPFHNTPIYRMISATAELILPLHLPHPRSQELLPQNCISAHDFICFCHEMAVQEIFRVPDPRDGEEGHVQKLAFPLPLEIHVIDPGGGVANESEAGMVKLEEIRSRPFQALVEGMKSPGLAWSAPELVDLRGFFALGMNTMVDSAGTGREMESRGFAAVSPGYVNFSARSDYHFFNLDAYAGLSMHHNYIRYRFQSGGAHGKRQTEQAKFISEILQCYGFKVLQWEDHLNAVIRKLSYEEILDLLKNFGRLMSIIRDVELTMNSDQQMRPYAGAFSSADCSPMKSERGRKASKG